MELEVDKLRCPHCKVRVRRPPPSTQDRIHRRTCKRCGKKYVVYDEVEHWFGTAEPPPMKVGDKFRISDKLFGSDSPSHEPVHTADAVFLTRSQGWWVNGSWKKGHCSIDCDNAVPVKGQKRGR